MTITRKRQTSSRRAASRGASAVYRGVAVGSPVVQALENRVLMAADFRISEFMASNVTTLADEDAQYSDWIEIRNAGDTAGSLANYRLTDNPARAPFWTLPDVTVPAGGHLVVFASGKNRSNPAGNLHTNFSLNADGEYLALLAPDGTVRTEFAPTAPDQEDDISYGTDPASGKLRYFARPTPGAPNVRAEVVINEIHYDPDVKVQLVEFVELHNPGAAPVDLSGATFTSGITYAFPAGSALAPGAYLVLAQNAAQFQAKYGVTPFGQYDGVLANEGETVTLSNRSGGDLDSVDYQPGFPWPTVGKAPGYSIELINPDFDNDIGGNWRAQVAGATPGNTLFASNGEWKYLKGTAEASSPVSAWRQPGFNEAGWSTGPGPVGYDGNSPMGTNLADMRGGYTSVFLRKTFNVTNPAAINALRLEANFDDGFNVWINGSFAYSQNVVGGQSAAYNGVASATVEDTSYRPFTLSPTLLRSGSNVIAVQFFNLDISSSSDAYFDARLIASAGGSSPTPGRVNSVYAANAAPQMRQVNHSPEQPVGGEPVTVTAKITDPEGVASATLRYQVVTPGNYIGLTDPAYQTAWTNLPMRDDGTGGDLLAGDGIYSAQVPAAANAHRNLVRYRVTTADALGAAITAPYADDAVPNFAYFVYNGVPSWTGAAQPGVSPSVNYTAETMNQMPAYHLLAKNADVENATWNSRYTGDNYLWGGTLVYDGKVYDHIHYRARGGVWRYAMVKNMWKFDFNHNHGFQARDNYGNKYSTTWDKLNLSAIIQQGNFWHRGEQGLFESVGMALFNLAGVAAPNTNFLQLRVIDGAQEYVDQYNGDLWGMYLAVEQPDGNFLDEHGLPDGNLYKMEGGTGELNNQGPTQPTDKSDLIEFQNGYRNPSQTDQWFRDNMNLDSYYGYRAIVEAIHHYDIDESAGKNYFFYHNPVTDKWETTVWDLDLTWANNMYGGGDEPFRDVVIPRPALGLEYRNRVRELRNLLFNPDQTGALIDEMAAKIYTPGQPSWVDIDRAVWDYNPFMDPGSGKSSAPDKAGQGRFYAGGPGITIPAPGGFAGMMQKMKDYASTQASQRGAHLDSIASDVAIPIKPTISYTGPAGFPGDRLTFRSSAFTDPQGAGTFGAMKWRIAEITNPAAPGYDPKAPKKYEINSVWESGEITAFTPDVSIPGQYVQDGKTYRVRVRMKDNTGRWSHWSEPAQFVAGQADQTVVDALRITEINYHPAANPAGPPAEDEFEFVELQNTSATTINLKDVRFANGIEYTFGDVTLAAGEYIVVARNRDAFAQRYGLAGINLAAGVFTKELGNSSDRIELVDALNQHVHDFTYFDTWHPSTDGEGPTMVVASATQPLPAFNTAAGWRPSSAAHGSPGRADGAADTTPPTADILDVVPVVRQTPIDSFTIVFSEPVTGFDLSDLRMVALGGAAVPFTGAETLDSPDGGRTWILGNTTALTNRAGGYGLTVLAGPARNIRDAAGNLLAVEETETWNNTNEPPIVVSVGPVSPDPRNGPVGDVTITFNEPVNGFDLSDLVLTHDSSPNLLTAAQTLTPLAGGASFRLGNLTGLTGSSGVYRLSLNPAGSGITDVPGSPITVGGSDTWTTDAAAPTANIVDVTPDPRRVPFNSITIVFSEPVSGFDKSDLTLTRNGGANLIAAFNTLSSFDGGRTWVLDGLPNQVGPEGTYVLTLAANGTGITDAAGNALAGGATDQWVMDFTRPTADIVDVTPDPRNTALGSISITFSELVAGFTLDDLTLTRDGGPNLLTASQNLSPAANNTWILGNLLGVTGSAPGGTYVLTLGTGVTDAAGNALAAPVTEQWVLDMAGPTADIIDVAPDPRSTPVDSIRIVFNEPVTGVDLSDLRLVARTDVSTNLLTAAQTLTTTDNVTWTLGNLSGITGPLGRGYQLTLSGGVASGVRDAAGNLMANSAFDDWTVAAVFGRHVFYNNSSYDGRSPSLSVSDDAAIATDKAALLPGGVGGLANYTSYAHGINGVMIDVAGLPLGTTRGLLLSDFTFKVGTSADPSTWAAAPAPLAIGVRRGGGAGGSDRVTLRWADGAIRNTWLQVTMLPNSVTGLAAPDVFYFGNLVGETGDSTTAARVTATDYAATRAQLLKRVNVTSRYDFDRDGRISTSDLTYARGATGRSIPLLNAPAAAAAASFSQTPIAATATASRLTTRRAWYEEPANVLA